MKNIKYYVLVCIGIIIISIIVVVYCNYPINLVGRKSLSMGDCSKSIEDSKKYGAFLFEYEIPTVIVYDSILIPFKTAFAERNHKWADYETDSIWFPGDFQIVVLLENKNSDLPGYGENWVVDGDFNMNWNACCLYRIDEGEFPPDTFICHIREQKHYKDSLGNIHYLEKDSAGNRWPCDTIQTFQLIRKY